MTDRETVRGQTDRHWGAENRELETDGQTEIQSEDIQTDSGGQTDKQWWDRKTDSGRKDRQTVDGKMNIELGTEDRELETDGQSVD